MTATDWPFFTRTPFEHFRMMNHFEATVIVLRESRVNFKKARDTAEAGDDAFLLREDGTGSTQGRVKGDLRGDVHGRAIFKDRPARVRLRRACFSSPCCFQLTALEAVERGPRLGN